LTGTERTLAERIYSMTWFFVFWVVSAITFVVSVYLTIKVVNSVVNINTVRINELKAEIEVLKEKLKENDEHSSEN
jgi:membrane protein insertase Oxa1/YidC/SpoIIIJ